MSILRTELVQWLDSYLEIAAFKDRSLNGLQLEGRATVSRIAVAVDSTLATLEEAAQSGADFLIVHHGWFWGQPLAIAGAHGKRVKTALEAGFSLYAAHLPLDAHPEVGNNVSLANALSLTDLHPFGEHKGVPIGVRGRFPVPLSLQDMADQIQTITGEICLVHGGGPGMISSVGICSGEGADLIVAAAAAGLDAFITGEPSHTHFSDPFEHGVNAIFCGHYESETLGVRALAVKLEDTFGLPWQFLHLPTGL
jgi:dinuclear metal center YbgI/SA1388 family protein